MGHFMHEVLTALAILSGSIAPPSQAVVGKPTVIVPKQQYVKLPKVAPLPRPAPGAGFAWRGRYELPSKSVQLWSYIA